MSEAPSHAQPPRPRTAADISPTKGLALRVIYDAMAGGIRFEWRRPTHPATVPDGTRPVAGPDRTSGEGDGDVVATGLLQPSLTGLWPGFFWVFNFLDRREQDHCYESPQSVGAMLRRISRRLPLAEGHPQFGVVLDTRTGQFEAGQFYPVRWRVPGTWQTLLARQMKDWLLHLKANRSAFATLEDGGRAAIRAFIQRQVQWTDERTTPAGSLPAPTTRLLVTLHTVEGYIRFAWSEADGRELAAGTVRCSGLDELRWELVVGRESAAQLSTHHLQSIRARLTRWRQRFPVANAHVSAALVSIPAGASTPGPAERVTFDESDSPWEWAEQNIQRMARIDRVKFSPIGRLFNNIDPLTAAGLEREAERQQRQEQRRAEDERRRREILERRQAKRRREEERAAKPKEQKPPASTHVPNRRLAPPPAPLPPVPLRIEMPDMAVQDTALPLSDLRGWRLVEQAMRWWVSNQSDDLLALPYCRIQKLDYQVRTALRVLGPLRGRALLSDEVGLGKTIEAGLVLKEWLTRGMVKRFLVLTVPSLVDQWEEELSDKFNLATVTTNDSGARADAARFWTANPGIVASLHTLKQPAHLEIARTVPWDLVIVDEAHYLRNRDSQAWQAVNALPRQFLLLLTATPVQNSLEELYNLVTLLQPGHLPTPKEFRARFLDPRKPRQPKEPEELRRLLGQVMIRNTRANSGVQLPPRRAETVVFEPDADEREFWQGWESALRVELARLSASQASLWGRLLLQTAGSSPAAWRSALEKFPNQEAAQAWRDARPLLASEGGPFAASWQRKCNLLPPLTRGEGGLVVFTQFLETQAALARALSDARVETFVINGTTPAADRQPITEAFRKSGGALLLTHSGTEGRNLQFCHRLVNFDLPWNPMEIEQRIGRLHRLGQQHPVRIYNLVQAGTLQEHLLQILQEKLNLFELVVGETGMILGERYGSDEFADEILRRWRESEGNVGEALAALGNELASARDEYQEIKQLDETLFAKDFETL